MAVHTAEMPVVMPWIAEQMATEVTKAVEFLGLLFQSLKDKMKHMLRAPRVKRERICNLDLLKLDAISKKPRVKINFDDKTERRHQLSIIQWGHW